MLTPTHPHTHPHTHTYAHIHTHTHTCTHMLMCMQTHTVAHTHTHTHTLMRMQTHTLAHMNTHTHTQRETYMNSTENVINDARYGQTPKQYHHYLQSRDRWRHEEGVWGWGWAQYTWVTITRNTDTLQKYINLPIIKIIHKLWEKVIPLYISNHNLLWNCQES